MLWQTIKKIKDNNRIAVARVVKVATRVAAVLPKEVIRRELKALARIQAIAAREVKAATRVVAALLKEVLKKELKALARIQATVAKVTSSAGTQVLRMMI